MKKSVKLVSVLLAVLMALSVFPMLAFADEQTENEAVVEGWKENYSLLLNQIYQNDNYVSWKYADTNMKAINDTMNVYTAFALYDNAWVNYASKTLNVDDAEKILLGLIEKAEYTFDDGYVDEIVSVLETAGDVNDFIQKVNKYADIELFASSGWGTAFEVIGDVTKIANAYQANRDKFIEMYARVLSVQMANQYYLDMLSYIVEKNSYDILTTAALNLIDDINTSVEDVVGEIVALAAEDGASIGTEYLLKLAMNSNAYTAVALKVYQGATGVADFLWNTGDQYALIDTVKTVYYFQSDVAEYAQAAVAGEDAEKALIAVDFALTTRAIAENALYNLKKAENGGYINKIKNQLYGTVYNDIEVNLAAIEAIRGIMYNTAVADMKPITRIITAYCPVNVEVLDGNDVIAVLPDQLDTKYATDCGVFVGVKSEYADTYHKVVFLYNNYRIRLVGTEEGYVTVVMDALKDGKFEDWSFTDRKVSAGTKITFDTDYNTTPNYLASDSDAVTLFNDVFVESKQPEVTAKDVVEATAEVTKKEVKSFGDIIKELFQKIIDAFLSIFKK